MKNKQNLSFEKDERDLFIQNIVNKIKEKYDFQNYDYVLIPETKNDER